MSRIRFGFKFSQRLHKQQIENENKKNIAVRENNCTYKKCYLKSIWFRIYKSMMDIADEFT